MKNKVLKLTAVLLLGFTVISCGAKKDRSDEAVEEKQVVRVANVFERDVDQIAEFTATIQPEVKNSIAPTTPGRIRRIMVDVGSRVSKGQRLVQMDAINLENFSTQIENLRQNYSRLLDLYEVGGVSKQDVDNLKAQLDQAEASMRSMQENTYLVSPINGIVTNKFYDSGDLFNGQQPVLMVMQINPLKVIINVSESYFPKVKEGMAVDISIDALPNESFVGKVSKIYPTVDEMTRSFGVEIRLNNPGNKIRPGMYARVNMNLGVESRVVVPDRAVIRQVGSGSRFVYVYEGGVVHHKEVVLGQRLGAEYELLSGVTSGSQVVIAGQSKLNDGDEVQLAEEAK